MAKKDYSRGVNVTDYKGNMIISLPTINPRYPFSFGVGKAKNILEHIDDIKLFVEQHSSKDNSDSKKNKKSSEDIIDDYEDEE
jgi:hypothetical protein